MNFVDVALVLLLVACMVRGWYRGLVREAFGFSAFLLGLLAALRLSEGLAERLSSWELTASLPEVAQVGAAFVAIFLAVSAACNLFGFALDRMLGGSMVRQLNNAGGAMFGTAKGAAVLAFLLLAVQLFPFAKRLDREVVASRLAQPLIAAADTALRRGWRGVGAAEERT